MELHIRHATDNDLIDVRRWLEADTGPTGFVSHYEPTKGSINLDDTSDAWVAEINGEMVAFASFWEEPPRQANLGFIVKPDRRREGIAKTFVPQLLEIADLQRYTRVVGTMSFDETAAQKVLQRAGFHPLGYDTSGRMTYEKR